MIPFDAKITGKADIKNYTEYLVEKAGPSIMTWIIEGAKKAIDKNFKSTLPECVRNAIDAYREENNWLGHFISDCCDTDPVLSEKSGELYQQYRAYCLQTGEYTRSTADFYSALEKAGYHKKKKTRARSFTAWPFAADRISCNGIVPGDGRDSHSGTCFYFANFP